MDSPYKSFARGLSRAESSLPPPTYVRYLPQGEISSAWQSAEVPHKAPRRTSAAQRVGLTYQKRIEKWAFEGSYSGTVLVSPWLCYIDASRQRHYCQPDLLFDDGTAMVVCEVKTLWTADAWWQVKRLYIPVLEKIFTRTFIPLCVCRSFDPAVVAPEVVELRGDLFDCQPDSFNVMVVQ